MYLFHSVEGEPDTEANPALALHRAFVEEGNFEFVSQLHVVTLLALGDTAALARKTTALHLGSRPTHAITLAFICAI